MMRHRLFLLRGVLRDSLRRLAFVAAAFGSAHALAVESFTDLPHSSAQDQLMNLGFGLDTGFNGGEFFKERFAGPGTSDYRGRKIARLSNGDLVSVGLVPMFQQANSPDGLNHIGLVRYRPDGQRVAWPYPSSFGFYDYNYIIYSGTMPFNDLTPRFNAVKDVAVVSNRLYVLVDHQPVGGNRDTYILIFSDDGIERGRFIGYKQLFDGGFHGDGGSLLAHSGLGGANPKLVATLTRESNLGKYISIARFNVDSGGVLSYDDTFGLDGQSSIFLSRSANNACSQEVSNEGSCPLVARSLAAGYRGLNSVGAYYIGADRLRSNVGG